MKYDRAVTSAIATLIRFNTSENIKWRYAFLVWHADKPLCQTISTRCIYYKNAIEMGKGSQKE